MSQTMISVFDLTPSEKLQLVTDLWDDLSAAPEQIPVDEAQIQELRRRRENLQAHPAAGLTWDEVQKRIRIRHGR